MVGTNKYGLINSGYSEYKIIIAYLLFRLCFTSDFFHS